MVKRILFIILVCCLSIPLFTACGQPESGTAGGIPLTQAPGEVSSTPVLTAPMNTTEEISISVVAPDSWIKKDDDSTLIWYENADDASFVNVLKPWIPSDAKNAMDVAKYEQQQINVSFQEAQVSEPLETKLDGIDAVRMELDIAISEELSQKQIYIYFFVDGTAYQVMGAYLSNNAQGVSDVESIIQSMKID